MRKPTARVWSLKTLVMFKMEITMKKILFTTLLVASFGAASSHANEVSSETYLAAGVNPQATESLRHCLQSDAKLNYSKAIRACSKAYKASIPNYDVRSDILTRRGWLSLSAGRFDKASRDFKAASKLNEDNEFAYLGKGYAAMMDKDYVTVAKFFNDCKNNHKAAPIATYGLAMTKELSGDLAGAIKTYV